MTRMVQDDGPKAGPKPGAVYAELAPLPRHGRIVDHLFILRDRGLLTGPERSVFASPFCELALVGHDGANAGGDGPEWRCVLARPRFGRQPRRAPFHGWMVGLRCDPLVFAPDATMRASLAGIADEIGRIAGGPMRLDAMVALLDRALDCLARDASSVASPRRPEGVGASATVGGLAAAAAVTPRTLRRRVRGRAGLSPKQYVSLRRFGAALRDVAADESFADVAVATGYCDQSHMTADLARHAGTSPGRLRAFARRHDTPDAARWLPDAAVRSRIRLLLTAEG